MGFGSFGGQAKDNVLAGKEIGGMGLKSHHSARAAQFAGQFTDMRDQGGMAAVHAIKIANRHHCTGQSRRRALGIMGNHK
jgi:hypothetical protein